MATKIQVDCRYCPLIIEIVRRRRRRKRKKSRSRSKRRMMMIAKELGRRDQGSIDYY